MFANWFLGLCNSGLIHVMWQQNLNRSSWKTSCLLSSSVTSVNMIYHDFLCWVPLRSNMKFVLWIMVTVRAGKEDSPGYGDWLRIWELQVISQWASSLLGLTSDFKTPRCWVWKCSAQGFINGTQFGVFWVFFIEMNNEKKCKAPQQDQ